MRTKLAEVGFIPGGGIRLVRCECMSYACNSGTGAAIEAKPQRIGRDTPGSLVPVVHHSYRPNSWGA